MRRLLTYFGNLLVLAAFVVGASVFVGSGGSSLPPAQIDAPPTAAGVSAPPTIIPTTVATPVANESGTPAAATPTPEARLPITHLVIASIGLDTDVVAAPLVQSDGAQTWQVPAFKAGHADATAGAGQRGNAVLMGHVSSLHSGDVFKNLDHVQVGDEVQVFSAERRFTYRVYETRSVPRTDVAMVEPTSEPIISLFTCTGVWDPVAWDFTQRFFVRARLVAG
jgi:sortase A